MDQAARVRDAVLAEQNTFLAQAAHFSGMLEDARAKVAKAEADLIAASEQVCLPHKLSWLILPGDTSDRPHMCRSRTIAV